MTFKKKAVGFGLGMILAFAGWSFYENQAHSQFTSAPTLELSCVHIYPIQMKYLEKHVNFADLSANLEARTVDQFVKRLDPSKLYLESGDVTKIQKLMSGVFNKTKNKDCTAIQKAYDIYSKRLDERVEYAKKFLGPKFKFDEKTALVLDPESRPRPKSPAEVNAFHNKYIQYQVSTYLASDSKMDEARNQVIRSYERFQRRMKDTKGSDLWAMYLDSFARALDPHSSYLSKDALEDFEIQMRLSLEGIGATLSSKDGFTVIEQLIPGGAAFGSGKLKPKDKIIAVAQGDDENYENVIEMDLRDVVRLIRGPKGSKVRLKILRKEKETERFEVTLVRDKIKLEDDAASIYYFDREVNGDKKKIGLINLPSFYADNRADGPSAAKDMKALLAEAAKKKVDAIVFDMSTNGGGSLRDAVDIAGLFFAKGNVVKQSQRLLPDDEKMQYEVLRDTDATVNFAGPLVVLTSRISASASEIVSGTLKDYRRAVVVGGDHTFGKGSVQSVDYMPPGLGAIKTTVGMFFIPGGASTQHAGVKGDIVFPSIYATEEFGEKTLDYSLPPKKIPAFLSKSAYGENGNELWKPLTDKIVKTLKTLSDKRVAESKDFKKIKDDIAKAKKHGKSIVVGELLKDKSADKKKGKDPEDPEDEDDGRYLTHEERVKKYLERADVLEAVNVAADLIRETHATPMTLGRKEPPAAAPKSETN
jgi:carboxyl-terminal processing protease